MISWISRSFCYWHKKINKKLTHLKLATPFILGCIACLVVMGPKILDPQNLGWLIGVDPIQHYIGWAFFREGPWILPIGMNPNYGLDLSSSIVFTDSIPLLAFFFKSISFALPETFQYLGLWTLVCFILQAFAGFLLLKLVTNDYALRILGSGYFIFAPPMLWRMGYHTALASHFVILVALYLCLSKQCVHRKILWALLISLTALIHFYLLVMVVALWVSNLLDFYDGQACRGVVNQSYNRKLIGCFRAILIEVTLVSIPLLFVLWQCGYFSIGHRAISSNGFGLHRMNLLALFHPGGWSYFIPSNHVMNYPGEGFSYLGLGGILILFFALIQINKNIKTIIRGIQTHKFFILTLLLLFFIALSNNVGIGGKNYHFDIPNIFLDSLNIIRSSGRMFWPMYYTIIFCALAVLMLTLPKKLCIWTLSIGLLLQIADTSHAWLPRRVSLNQNPSEKIYTPSIQNYVFWNCVAKNYKKIIMAPPRYSSKDWVAFSVFAAEKKMSTNAVYLARTDQDKLMESTRKVMDSLHEGDYDKSSIYVIENQSLPVALSGITSNAKLVYVDGYNILLPDHSRYGCGDALSQNDRAYKIRDIPDLEKKISFQAGSIWTQFLIWGWSDPESWGSWSDGNESRLILTVPSNAKTLELTFRAMINKKNKLQPVEVFVDNKSEGTYHFHRAEGNSILLGLTDAQRKKQIISIQFKYQKPIKPSATSQSEDQRSLAIGIESAVFK